MSPAGFSAGSSAVSVPRSLSSSLSVLSNTVSSSLGYGSGTRATAAELTEARWRADTMGDVSAREAQTDAPVGGQAVLEGVMMRGVSTWAVAVRKPSAEQLAEGGPSSKEGSKGEIDVVSEPLVSWTKRHRLLRLPLIRGVVALAESLKIGFNALGISANAQMPPDEEGEGKEIGGGAWFGTVAFALLFAVGLFFLL